MGGHQDRDKTEYTDKLVDAKDRVTKAMKQSIMELKQFIKKRDDFYSKDVNEMDFKKLEGLGKEMEAVIVRASSALNATEGVKLMGELDRSVAKMRKVNETQDQIRVAEVKENKERMNSDLVNAMDTIQ
tara:strand:- start:2066 stop:2452 length:387 start_codon:yes stop_codon:yes gene_type:complete